MTQQQVRQRQGKRSRGMMEGTSDTELFSIVVDEDAQTSMEMRDFNVPKRQVFREALFKEARTTVSFSGIKFRNISASAASVSKLLSWDFELGGESAAVYIHYEADLDFLVANCQLKFLSKGIVEREGEVVTKKSAYFGDTNDGERKRIYFNFLLDGYWPESIDQIRVILTFPSGIQIIQPEEGNEVVDRLSMRWRSFKSFFMSAEFSDIVISSGSVEWPAHKIVLAHISDVFKRMLQSDMKEVQEGRLKLDTFEPCAVKEMLRFVYTGKFEADPGIVVELLKLAHAYEIKGLKKRTVPLILASITLENVPEMYMLGEVYDLKAVRWKAMFLAKSNKKRLIKDPENLKKLTDAYPKFMFKFSTDE